MEKTKTPDIKTTSNSKGKKGTTKQLISELSQLKPLSNKELESNSYYFTGSPITNNPIWFITVVSFHHKQGSIIDFIFPSREEIISNCKILPLLSDDKPTNEIWDDILMQLTYNCLPDGCHLINEDNQFFFIQNYKFILYGISCFRQVKSEIDDEWENTRNCVQKAMCIVSTLPWFGQWYSKLSLTIAAYFNQTSLRDKKIIAQLNANFANINYNNLNSNEIYLSFSLRKLICFTKEKIWWLIKLMWLEKKIMVYGKTSGDVCSFILTLISIIPGNLWFNWKNGKQIETYVKGIGMYGLPIKCFNKEYKLYPWINWHDIDNLDKKCGAYLVGTTNQLILNMQKLQIDCFVNWDTLKMSFGGNKKQGEHWEKICKISKLEKKITSNLIAKLKECNCKYETENWITNWNLTSSSFAGSDDYIRSEFKNYFFDLAVNLSLSIEIVKSANDEFNKTWELLNIDEITEDLSKTSNSKLLNGSKKIAKKTIKKILGVYNTDWLWQWSKTLNFQIWNTERDPKLDLRSTYYKALSNVMIYFENGDTYSGSLSRGKRQGIGLYIDYDNKSTYNGEWRNDLRNGTGTWITQDNKCIYDGDWVNGCKSGTGQLINQTVKYSGGFNDDLYEGNGVWCDENGNVYEGDFRAGKYHGMGKLKKVNGDYYIGMFSNGWYEGKGQWTTAEGSIYNGDFMNNWKSGEGVLITKDGTKLEGVFSWDKYVGKK